jgi:plastocyanin
VENTVRASVNAENAKDVDAFLALWTDKGLSEYDVGTRKDVESGSSENFGSDRVKIVRFANTKLDGSNATTTLDVSFIEAPVAKPLYRLTFKLMRRGDRWLMNGFEFVGSPPPPRSATVVTVKASDYAFALDPTKTPADLAVKFSNVGKEAHELTLFKGPDGVEVAKAKADLERVDGEKLDNVPAGYKVDHLSYAEPGKSESVTFAEPLEAGTYVLACYLPQGGLNDKGEPVNPKGKPHIQLGMINVLTVE